MNSGISYTKWLIEKLKFRIRENPNLKKTTLNIDCQLSILEELEFVDLLSVSQTNKQLSALAVNVFIRKFSKSTIEIKDGPAWHPSDDSEEDINYLFVNFLDVLAHIDPYRTETEEEFEIPALVTTFDKLIQIQDFKLTVLTLKHFGSVIEKLKINYSFMNLDQLNRINEIINEYCSESLIEVHLDYCEDHVLSALTKPFTKIQSVTFGMEMKTIGKSLYQLFLWIL